MVDNECLIVLRLLLVLLLPLTDATTQNTDGGVLFVGGSAHEPKFGERLLPLQRNKAATKANAFVNNVLNKSKREDAYTLAVTTFDDTLYETALKRREDRVVPEESPGGLVNASKADRLEMSTEFFVVPTSASLQPTVLLSATPTTNHKNAKTQAALQNGGHNATMPAILLPTHFQAPTIVAGAAGSAGGLRKEPWVVPVLVLASLTMLMMAAFEIFVLFKAWRTSPSRRHLFLGQMLLLGLFACAGLAAIITAQPTLLSCGTLRFGIGVAYALVFAALLVKCVFLISLNGGVYLPAPYQGLLLLFAVLIQVAIGAQWLLTQPPELYTLHVPAIFNGAGGGATSSLGFGIGLGLRSSSSIPVSAAASATKTDEHKSDNNNNNSNNGSMVPLCKSQFSQLLFSLSYIFFLIVFVAVLATKSRGIRDNYREATYIGLAIGGAIPIWFGWMLCGLAVAERHKDACVAFGLVATSVTVFLVMFMPKGRQLAAMGKEGLYVEDREEQFSSLSRAGSGYSPSFFHFKPIKYGVMGGGCGTIPAGGAPLHNTNANGTINGARTKHHNGPANNANEGETL